MSKFNSIQANFTAGEVSDRLKGRKDLKEYKDACEKVENFIVHKTGGAIKRPGSQFVEHAKDSSSDDFVASKIFPFKFSNNEAFIIVINENFDTTTGPFRVYRINEQDFSAPLSVEFRDYPWEVPSNYDVNKWDFAQSGDILVLAYSGPVDDKVAFDAGTNVPTKLPPCLIYRMGDGGEFDNPAGDFRAVAFPTPVSRNSSSLSSLPINARFSSTVYYPYLDTNTEPDLQFYVNNIAVGSGRTMSVTDTSAGDVAFFERGHVHTDELGRSAGGASPRRIGAFFKVTKGSTTGVFYPTAWKDDITSTSIASNIVTTGAAHGYVTGNVASLAVVNTINDVNNPDVDSSGEDSEGYYGDYFVEDVGATQIAFHKTLAEAQAALPGTRVSISAGTEGIRIKAKKLSSITGTIEVAMEGTLTSKANASDNWNESAWSDKRGFPRTVAFHEQRLVFGGSEFSPDTLWFSDVGNIYNFMMRRLEQDTSTRTTGDSGFKFVLISPTAVTDPFAATIAAKEANQIQWLSSQNVLLLGTIGSEYTVDGGQAIISNENILVKKQTDTGSKDVQAIGIGVSTIFVSRDGRRVYDFKFNDNNGSYVNANLNVHADHIVFSGFDGSASSALKGIEIDEMVHQPSRDVIWFRTTRGELIGITLSRESNITAWHYHPLRSTDTLKSITVIPSEDGTFDNLVLLVERSIDGDTEIYLEKIGDDFEHDVLANTSSDNDDVPYYSDAAVKVVLGSATSTVTLPNNIDNNSKSHLEGETVKILAGGVVETDKTVSSGQVTLDAVYPLGTVVILGLPYTATLRTLDIEAGGDLGSSEGNRQRIDRVAIRLYKSQDGKYKNSNASALFDIEYDDEEVFTGIKRLDFEITPDMDNQVEVEHDDPTPFTILNMTYRGVSYD